MKQFDLPSQAVIMCGISGSGKTRIARMLEEKGYVRLSVDALIWEKVGQTLYKLPKEEKSLIFAESMSIVQKQLVNLLKSGQKVVVDATFCQRSARDQIRNLCAEIHIKPVFVYCEVNEEELWKRLSQRKGKGPDDLLVSRDELSRYCHGFEGPQENESDFIYHLLEGTMKLS